MLQDQQLFNLVLVIPMFGSLSLVRMFMFVIMGVTMPHIAMFVLVVVLDYGRLFIEASATLTHMLLLVFVSDILVVRREPQTNPYGRENKSRT